MPNPGFSGLDDPRFEGLDEAMEKAGGEVYNAHKFYSPPISSSAFARRWDALQRFREASPGQRESILAARLDGLSAAGGWIITDKDGEIIRRSTRWKADAPQDDPERLLEAIKAGLADITALPEIAPPKAILGDMLSAYILPDAHLGMHAWGAETGGQDYDLKLADSDLRTSLTRVIHRTPPAETALLLINGDFFHADDSKNETPANRHRLDVDGRHVKVATVGAAVVVAMVAMLAQKHEQVIVRIMRGNHDEHSHLILHFSVFYAFRDNPRVVIEDPARDLFYMRWGDVVVAAQHGDKTKPVDLILKLADEVRYWSECTHRHVFTGHRHREASQQIGGAYWECMDALCPPDAYGSRFVSRRKMQSIQFDKTDGIVGRVYDPMRRETA